MSRKQKRRPASQPLTYSVFRVMLADPVNPMPEARRRHQLTRMLGGLAAIERGAAPTPEDWRLCSDAVNLLETLVKSGALQDDGGLVMDGIEALAKAGARHLGGGQIRLDGPGIAAMRAVLEDYATALGALPERTIVQAHRDTEIRIRAILAGKRQAHDIEIIDL